MNNNSKGKESNLIRRNLLIKALNAFDEGDVDLARRVLIASYHHHTRKTSTVRERLNLWWCLAWFAFYEGCSEKGELIVRKIVKLEESFVEPRKSRIIYAKYVLSIFCSKSGKESEAMKHAQEVAELLKESDIQPFLKQIVTTQLTAKKPAHLATWRTIDQVKNALGATGTSHEIFF